jgi:hypothetical protein
MGMRVSRKGAKAQRRRREGKLRGMLSISCLSLRLSFAPLRLCAICLLFFITQAQSQQGQPAKKDAARERRTRAIELITETADAARTFKDLFYRARLQTLAADALWPHDETRARTIFRRAWEAATAYDKAEQEAEESESGVPSTIQITEARDEVLAKVAARDSKLAEVFLNELLKQKEDEKNAEQTQSSSQRRTPWREVSAAGLRRLALAYDLLNRKEPAARAAEIAAPVIAEGESADLLAFITRLRETDNRVGDAFYLRLINRVRTDRGADVNTVLLLSSQTVSPYLLVVVDERGALQFRSLSSTLTAASDILPNVTQPALNAFYSMAAKILLRPIVPRRGQSATPEAIALYFAIGRLLPFFEREAPQAVASLRLRSSTLMNEIEAGRRETLNSQFELASRAMQPGDPLRSQLDQLGRARDVAERDRVALGIVRKAARLRLWDRARRAAGEIEDGGMRSRALSFIAVSQIADLLRAFADDKETNFDSLSKFVRDADAPAVAIAWGLAQTAVIAARQGDAQTAGALLDEAEAFAARTPAGTRERVAAYTAVARLAVRVEVKRAWELLPEIVRAVNALEDYAGDEASIELSTATDGSNAEEAFEPLGVEAEVFRLDGIFATMAHIDYEKTLAAARSLGKELPQAFASLAIARVMLNTEARTQNSEE